MPFKNLATRQAWLKEKMKDPDWKAKRKARELKYRIEHRESACECSKQWAADNPDKVRERDKRRWLQKRYKLKGEVLERLLKRHKAELKNLKIFGHCGICGNYGKLDVDHDHRCCKAERSCGKCIRGLLCRRHNNAIGLFRDNPEEMKIAIRYLIDTAQVAIWQP